MKQAISRVGVRIAGYLRSVRAFAGIYSWVLAALLVASPNAMAVDLDIYTKALTSGVSGSPVLILQIDNSGSMLRKVTSTSSATSALDQRLYRMADVAMAQVAGMKGTFQIGITSYSGDSTGQRLQIARPLSTELPNSPGTTTFPTFDEKDDATQVYGSGAVLGDKSSTQYDNDLSLGELVNVTKQTTSIGALYATGTWPSSSYLAAAELPAATGSAGTASGLMAGAAGNTVIWYTHGAATDSTSTSSTLHQIFKVTGATANSYMTITDAAGTVINRSPAVASKTSNKLEIKVAECGVVLANDICLAAALTANTTYRIVIGTDTNGAAGNFTFQVVNTGRAAAVNPYMLETLPPQMPRRAGVQFRRIDIPRGATITNAYLEFKSAASQSTAGKWRAGVDTSASPYTPINGLYGRTIDWTSPVAMGSWSNDEVGTDTRITVTSKVQTHVNQSDWCGGDMMFLVDSVPVSDGTTATVARRDAYSYDGVWNSDNGVAPKLVVQWAAGADPGGSDCTSKTMTIGVDNVSDDVAQGATGTITFDGLTMPVSSTQQVGLRFPLIPLPQGVTVVDAKLELTPVSGSVQAMKVRVIEGDNAAPFAGTTSALDALTFTADSGTGLDYVAWTPGSWTSGTPVQTVNLATIVQPIFDRAGWNYDNGLGFVIEGSAGSASAFHAWEKNSDATTTLTDRTKFGRLSARLILTVTAPDAIVVQKTHRWNAFNTMNSMPAIYSTPIMGTYIESAQYLLGWDNFNDQMPVMSTGDCATNGIVILTDGEETGSYGAAQTGPATAISGLSCSTSSTTNVWTCLYRMITAMYEKRNTHDDGETYSVRTDAIGFGPEAGSSTGLAGVEGKGGGKFYLATDSAGLSNAFRDIISNMSISTASVAASGVAVNALNRFEHLDQLYYSLFAPSTQVDWSGNLKRYRLKDSEVMDILNVSAIDELDTGFFKSDARSYWDYNQPLATDTDKFVDGSTVSVGGAAGKTLSASRFMFTYLGANPAGTATTLTDQISTSNSAIDKALVGVTLLPYYGSGALATTTQQNARRNAVIDFLRAAPVTDTTIRWGAAIHASPRVVTYDPDAKDDNGDPAPVVSVFYGDSRGFLHGIDAGELSSETTLTNANNSGGGEMFAFAPKELLKNAAFFYDNTETIASNGYRWGFDGDISVYRDPVIGKPTTVTLFAGMRRGGKNYYALDASKSHMGIASASERIPKLKWIIEGGTGNFTEMGQSWSAISTAKIKLAGTATRVAVFSGGYDPAYHDDSGFSNLDGVGYTNTNQLGRAIYIVNQETGALILKTTQLSTATFPALLKMKYSITATPRLLDRNSDGYVDALYVVDLAGQVFRIELSTSAASASSLVTSVILVAQLGATAPGASATADNRRFFEPPSIARVGNDIVLALVSGYREEARSKITDEAFFFLTDDNAYKTGATSNSTLVMSALDDLTGTDPDVTADPTKPGWFFYLDQTVGEKGLGSPVIFNFSILFSAWNSENADVACSPDIGKTNLYFVSFKGAGLANGERSIDIQLPGFGDTPQVLFQESGLAVAVGIRVIDADDLCTGAGCLDGDSGGAGVGIWNRSSWSMIDPE